MEGISKTFEDQQIQFHPHDDLMLAEEALNHQEGTMSQLDYDLMLSDDAFDRSEGTTQSQNDSMLLDDDVDAQPDNLTPFSDFNEIPHYLPEKALLTASCSIAHANGSEETYITVHNTPKDNYVAQKINDGNEFAIGGDSSHIIRSLDREFHFQPQQRWHVIVIAENNIQLTGVPRRSYPLVSGMGEGSFTSKEKGVEVQQNHEGGDILMDDGYVKPTGQDQISQTVNGRDSSRLGDGPAVALHHSVEVPTCTTPGRFQQNGPIDSTMVAANDEHTSHLPNHRKIQSPQTHDPPRLSSMPPNTTPVSQLPAFSEHNKRKQLHQQTMDPSKEEEKQKRKDALIIAADNRFESYAGTNLCRWCGRRGHEAVQCIKWDPEHFDKLVCIVCNNKKHLLDDCLRFEIMSEEAKIKLVLVDGANRPGARSFFWPWVCTSATSPVHAQY